MCCYTRGRDSCHLQDLTKDTHKGVRLGRQMGSQGASHPCAVIHVTRTRYAYLFLSTVNPPSPTKEKKIHHLPTYMCTKSTPLPSALLLTPVHRMLFIFQAQSPAPSSICLLPDSSSFLCKITTLSVLVTRSLFCFFYICFLLVIILLLILSFLRMSSMFPTCQTLQPCFLRV